MSLERVPADIRKQGGVARMTDPKVQCNPQLISWDSPIKNQHVIMGVISPIIPS